MTNTASYYAGVEAADDGTHIDNSYPWDHEEWVKGYKSVKPQAQESLWLKELWIKNLPEEYAPSNDTTLKHREELIREEKQNKKGPNRN